MGVRFLDPTLVNQIAAGEVIERPASALKELVENSIDAGATQIDVMLRDGGKTYLSVTDNGQGMSVEDLNLCIERHATSKIPDNDLFNIQTLGFRGEALPAIGSVSRVKIITRQPQSEMAWELTMEGGVKSLPFPSVGKQGTRIEIRDLFYATPARLKFLKASSTERSYIVDTLERFALIHPEIDFTLQEGDRSIFSFTKTTNRMQHILGKDFYENSHDISYERHVLTLTGRLSIPTYNHSSSTHQYLFVNKRPVKDKLLNTAIRIAYQDVLSSNRYPALCLFFTCPTDEVDINVHPAKSEVRFRDASFVRNFVITAIRESLGHHSSQPSKVLSSGVMKAFEQSVRPLSPLPNIQQSAPLNLPLPSSYRPLPSSSPSFQDQGRNDFCSSNLPLPSITPSVDHSIDSHYLGDAKAQIQNTYIIAESKDHLVIVDQHAAHERLVYEQKKQEFNQSKGGIQVLLIPYILEMTESHLDILKTCSPFLLSVGFSIEFVGKTGAVIRQIPSLLQGHCLKQLMNEMVFEVKDQETTETIPQKINDILAEKSCKNSIRAGRKLSVEEMNALLRQMEKTPSSAQCNHGRPTFITLNKEDLDKLFGRT